MRERRTIVHRIGDTCPEDHGGGALMKQGRHLVLEYTHGAEGEGLPSFDIPASATMEIFRVSVPTDRGRAEVEGVRSDLDWCDWRGIAGYVGMSPWEILEIALDPDRCWALYELAASYHGWRELDPDPLSLPYWQISRRWTTPRRRAA